jgi:hypothetical protein
MRGHSMGVVDSSGMFFFYYLETYFLTKLDSSRMFLPRMDSSRMYLPRKYLSR